MSELNIMKIGCLTPSRENRANPSPGRVFSGQGLAPCIDTCQGGGLQPHIVTKDNTMNKNELDKYRIRKLTPKECFRLQGWNDEYFSRAELVNSNTQLYKQAGNGVTVDVIKAIGDRLHIFNS